MKKTILITGSTDGIGKLAAIKLAKEGHEIYLHGRNKEKVERVILEVKGISNNEQVKGFVADFSDLDAIRQMSQQVIEQLEKVDVLINNAGVFKSSALTNADGLELRFVVNYLAPYLLTHLLMPLLEKNPASRIINLSSAAQAPVELEALTGARAISTQAAYAQSKLALTMWSFNLARKYKDTVIIALNPGSLLNTNMVREAYGRHWSSADKGGQILYELAISSEYSGASGQYFDNDKGEIKGAFGKAHEDAYDETKITQLIAQTNQILGLPE